MDAHIDSHIFNEYLHGIYRNQYGHPGPAIGYLPTKCLGHVYMILEPVGSHT